MEHYPVTFERYQGAYGLLSRSVPTTGIIFVHGFDGNARTTWEDFQGLIEQIPGQRSLWNQCDLFFYTYKSYDQIPALADPFLEFLTSVATDKERGIISSDFILPSSEKMTIGVPADLSGQRGRAPYNVLILVGHSTGALIIREALLTKLKKIMEKHADLMAWVSRAEDVEENHNRLIAKSHLRFFAPAHLGVMAAGKLGLARSVPIIDRIIGAHLRSNPLYQNLKHTSPIILDLRKTTEQLYEKNQVNALKARSLFGQHEEIVYLGSYSHDEPNSIQPGHNHTSVCKPTSNYLRPLEFVIDTRSIAKNA